VEFNVRGTLDEQEDVLRCLRNLILTPAGTIPLDRDFGIDNSCLGYPIDVAQNVFAVELIDKVQKYEPRANVVEVSFTPDNNGRITAEVVITSG
jgi:hypothetical protein